VPTAMGEWCEVNPTSVGRNGDRTATSKLKQKHLTVIVLWHGKCHKYVPINHHPTALGVVVWSKPNFCSKKWW